MAKAFKETPNSDVLEQAMPGEAITLTRTFTFVYDDVTYKNSSQVLADALVPKPGTRHDTRPEFVVRNVQATPIPQSPRAWQVRVTYSTRKPYVETKPWFRITRSTSFRTAAGYRSGNIWTGVPANGTVAFPPTADMGGTKVDSNGQPLQWKIAQQTITVEHLWDRTKDTAPAALAGAAASPDPPSEWTSVYCNTRNNAAFLGWPAGYVTYMGWTANQSPDEWLVISHRFLADDWQHLEQRPAPNAAGTKLLDVGPTWAGYPTKASKTVVWYQPYETVLDFSALFTWRPNLWSAMTTPQPSWPP